MSYDDEQYEMSEEDINQEEIINDNEIQENDENDRKERESNMNITENDVLKGDKLPKYEIEESPIINFDFAKKRIGFLCTSIISDTTSIDFPLELRELLSFCSSKNMAISGLARFSLTKVFCDIRPDYIIKSNELLTSAKGTLSIAVRKRVTFEQNLISYYGKFISLLKSEIMKPSFKRLLIKGSIVKTAMAQILLKVICDLLKRNWHFNFHITLVELSMIFLFSSNEEFNYPISQSLQEVIQDDLRGDVTLEIVRRIAQTVKKQNYECNPNTIRPFLVVESTSEEINPFNIKTNPRKEELKNIDHKKQKLSRKKLKELRIERKLDKDVKLIETKYSVEEKKKYNMLVLDTIFRTYFRVLKENQESPLVPLVLEGMSIHTHKINYDFMLDIIKLLQQLLENKADKLQPIDTIRVCYTIFNTLKLQNFLVTIDNVQFYESMYKVLDQILLFQDDFIGEHHIGNRQKLVGVLKIMLLDVKQLPPVRIASFVKRILIMMLNCDSSIALDFCAILTWIFKRYRDTFIGLIEQENGFGIYNPSIQQPDHSGAINSCLWELTLLQIHHNPQIRKWVDSIKILLIKH
ncbi:hypothetical protein, conserved [Entamoeba dispar SAW760]|uniref:CCAAT-binding factor domain-containing protein n=1 Tax=Entamoeba dispar (strain ATCC PRA-260 / SAW760) TaxID=370354 RepID=B0EFJ7_ENTDS|nr:uncharacterized protein EDI_271950 [Entamoeba dispar SAW760]EDR26679.1 hypothetical protein, conserved [Entamoeba dispar SAW760]|eukprot:EDR26679.1 hypothetical protein, conserved [Entamoeba dispar SAW760]